MFLKLLSLAVLLQYTLGQDSGPYYFVGKGTNSMFFVQKGLKAGWMYTFEYCHTHDMMPGQVRSESDLRLVANFLQTQFPDEQASLWLPATDHNEEGVYKWLYDFAPVTIGNWSTGMPSGDRSKNCLAINREGLFEEASCSRRESKYGLCETPIMNREVQVEKGIGFKSATVSVPTNLPDELVEIGNVGNKVFYAEMGNNLTMDWLEAFDYCHQHGLRMASPVTQNEYAFLLDVAVNTSYPHLSPLFMGASDMMSLSCLRANSKYRNMNDGRDVEILPQLNFHSWWYQCAFITRGGPTTTACLSGSQFGVICEGDGPDPPICEPGDTFVPHQDCQHYYICEEGGPILRSCPSGLYWNDELKACDFPINVPQCSGGTRPPPF